VSEALVIVPRASVGADRWDALANESDDAWHWHHHVLQGAMATWTSATDESFAVADPTGAIVAVVPARRIRYRRARLLAQARLESVGGPAVAEHLEPRRRQLVMRAAIDELRAQLKGGDELLVILAPMAPAIRGERCPRVNPLLEAGLENVLSQTWVVDLRVGEETVWHGLKTRARRAVRSAEKAGVSVRHAAPDDLDAYVAMHQDTYRRTGATPHPRAYFAAIWRDLLPTGRAQIFVAEREGAVIGACNYAVDKGAAFYWTGASTPKGLQLHANYLLHWVAMKWMLDAGLDWCESGEAFPGARADKSGGLSYFKASFGGELYPYYRGRWRRPGARAVVSDALDLGWTTTSLWSSRE